MSDIDDDDDIWDLKSMLLKHYIRKQILFYKNDWLKWSTKRLNRWTTTKFG